MIEKNLNTKLIKNLIERKNDFVVGETEKFLYKNDNGNEWDLILKKEEEQYYPFIFAVEGKKIGTNEIWSRRYKSIEQAILHILNDFNENANIKNKYQDLDDYILKKEQENTRKFDYMMLDRLRTDCGYFLTNGNGNLKDLYYKDIDKHIDEMKKIYNSFSKNERPEWITLEEIETIKEAMKEKLKERNFKRQDYKYIIQCDLSSTNSIYTNQYLLVEDVNLPSDLDVDLIGNCCFNCDYEILAPKMVAKIYSLEEVKSFCKQNRIDIKNNIDKEGNLIIGGAKDQIIANDMNRYDREKEINLENEQN